MALSKPQLGTTKTVVVALDFGTTYSGYAFSFRDNPLRISTNHAWIAGFDRLMSLKTATCVLLDPDQKFDSFGYEAENKYTSLAEENEHHGWYYFSRFKMMLYDTKVMTVDTEIEDIDGKKLPAIKVFEHSIRYLKEHFLKALQNQTTILDESDILYVLTVPAIWDDRAKIFMRKAAVNAGIPSTQLRMALEPEAASLWCQVDTEKDYINLGGKYMVVDLGGGTADITVNEKNVDGTLNELHKATGGTWGGTEVDKQFENVLCHIFGHDVVEELKQKEMGDYLNVLRSFEMKKRNLNSSFGQKVVIWIPTSMREIFNEKGRNISEMFETAGLTGKCELRGDKLKMETTIMEEWFKGPMSLLVQHMRFIFTQANVTGVDSILLVGGFAESNLVQKAVRDAFPAKKVITPHDAGMVVLKGAVRFGHFPELIACRRSKYSYGLSAMEQFDSRNHPKRKMTERYGRKLCTDIFDEIISINQPLQHGKNFDRAIRPLDKQQKSCCLALFASCRNGTSFIDDEECSLLENIKVEFPAHEGNNTTIGIVSLIFWDTEIKFQVHILATGERHERTIDRL